MTEEPKSGSKIAKKARRLYRREMRREARDMGKTIGNAMRPKPKLIPWRVWLWAAGFFIKIKK